MAKVRTLSQKFPKGHIRQGEPTYFVEKVLNSLDGIPVYMTWQHLLDLNDPNLKNGKITEEQLWEFWRTLSFNRHLPKIINEEKHHTIRAGHHFKTGDEIQLAVWSGKPYASPQIKIAPPLKVTCYDFEIEENIWPIGPPIMELINGMNCDLEQVAKNDGLTLEDFKSWFKYPKTFEGQIICFNEKVNY